VPGEWKIPASEIDRLRAYWKRLSKVDKLDMLDVDAEGVVKRLVEKIAANRDIDVSEIPPEVTAPFVTALSSPEIRASLCMEFLQAVESVDGKTQVVCRLMLLLILHVLMGSSSARERCIVH
jgi:hypothetical protein